MQTQFLIIISSYSVNSIKTEKVVVDTQNLITSIEKLLKTDKVVCWLKDDIEISLAKDPRISKDFYIKKLYNTKKFKEPTRSMDGEYSDKCLLNFVTSGNGFDLKNKVLFISKPTHYTFLAYFANFSPNARLWVNEKSYLESISVYYYRRGLTDYQRRTIDEK